MITQACLFKAIFAAKCIQMLSVKVSHTEQIPDRITVIKGGGEGKLKAKAEVKTPSLCYSKQLYTHREYWNLLIIDA